MENAGGPMVFVEQTRSEDHGIEDEVNEIQIPSSWCHGQKTGDFSFILHGFLGSRSAMSQESPRLGRQKKRRRLRRLISSDSGWPGLLRIFASMLAFVFTGRASAWSLVQTPASGWESLV